LTGRGWLSIASPVTSTRKALLHHPSEWRSIAIVCVYLTLLAAMYAWPACRNLPFFAAACYFSFLNTVVIHNHLHRGVFTRKTLNDIFRCVLSFGALYPASANIPSHNLVHHHFDDDGRPDWAAPTHVRFLWPLLNLLHFPNVAGPNTFAGVQRWMQTSQRKEFARQYYVEQAVAFGLTGALLLHDFWTGLFFVVLPQLYGARNILRINLIQHEGCDTASEWNHSRNFVGRAFNWIMCNNGYHTIHHNRAGLHWTALPEAHAREVVPRTDPSLNEPSMIAYLVRTFGLGRQHPALRETVAPVALPPREARKQEAEAQAFA
jgi:fatty acid desaturase